MSLAEPPGSRPPTVVAVRGNRRRIDLHQLYGEPPPPRRGRVAFGAVALLVALALVGLSALRDDGGPTGPAGDLPASAPAVAAAPPVTMNQLAVVTGLRADGLEYDWAPPVAQVAPSGACGTNRQLDEGSSATFYLEQQSCGEDVLVPALLAGDTTAMEVGLQALDWAFAREAADGSFPGEADAFHSTSIFLASAARVVLLVRESPYAARYSARLDGYAEALSRAAAYELRPSVLKAGRAGDVPYGHRRFLLGAAIGLVADVSGSKALQAQARGFFRDGMALQLSDGEIPELGGPESHYQAYGMMFAIAWVSENPEDPIAAPLAETIDRAMAWERSRVLPDGRVSTEGNTRTAGQERNRDGTPKKLIYHDVIRALGSWALLRDSAELRAAAQRVADYKQAHPGA